MAVEITPQSENKYKVDVFSYDQLGAEIVEQARESADRAESSLQILSVASVEALGTVNRRNLESAVVRDTVRGGNFTYKPSTDNLTVDNGVIFPAQDGGYWVRQFSGDCSLQWYGASSDYSSSINSALNHASTLGVNLYIPFGVYHISDTIVIPDRTFLIGIGQPTIKLLPNSNKTILRANGKRDCGAKNFIIDQDGIDNQNFIAQNLIYGVDCTGSENIVFEDLYVKNCVRSCFNLFFIKNLSLLRCTADKSGIDGFTFDHVEDSEVRNCTARNMLSSIRLSGAMRGFEVQEGCRNISFYSINAKDCQHTAGFGIATHYAHQPAQDINIYGLTTTGCDAGFNIGDRPENRNINLYGFKSINDRRGMLLTGGRDVLISGFTIKHDGAGEEGIVHSFTENLTIENGTVTVNGIGIYAQLYGDSEKRKNIKIDNVKFFSQNNRAVWLRFSNYQNLKFSDCTFSTNGSNESVWINSNSNESVSFIDCTFFEPRYFSELNPGHPCLKFRNTIGMKIRGCIFWNTTRRSIEIENDCKNITVNDCDFNGIRSGSASNRGIDIRLGTYNVKINNSRFWGIRFGVYADSNNENPTRKVHVIGCSFENSSSRGVYFLGSGYGKSIISLNTFDDIATSNIDVPSAQNILLVNNLS